MARLIGILLAAALVVLVLKWALTTAAVLPIPFGVRWFYDRTSVGSRPRS